jgi:lysophospholipase L1-like esterase
MIGDADLSAYTIVYARSNRADLLEKYPDGYPATEFHKETAERLSDLIHSLYGVRLPVVCDQETEEGEHEILVGRTNRPLSSTLSLKKLKEDKYTVCVSGDTLVICGGGYGSTWHAVDYVEELLRSAVAASDTYTFPADLLHNGTFDFIRIVCIGDSITEGVGVSEPTQYAYPAQLERWLWKDVLVENLGKSGKTMRDDLADSYMKTGSYKRVLQLAEETDVFTVMLGTNDGNRIGTGWSAEDSAAYKRDFEVLLRSISEKNPNARFVIMNCPTTFRDAAQNYDCAEIRAKLEPFVPNGFSKKDDDPTIPELLKLMMTVTEWRDPSKKGKKVYDDKGFVESLAEQYERRHSLSDRQVMALKRVAVAYRDKIPGYDAKAAELGLVNIPSSSEKSAEVIDGSAAE